MDHTENAVSKTFSIIACSFPAVEMHLYVTLDGTLINIVSVRLPTQGTTHPERCYRQIIHGKWHYGITLICVLLQILYSLIHEKLSDFVRITQDTVTV
jgi:hypothetical protein